jgi:hypothetical protein
MLHSLSLSLSLSISFLNNEFFQNDLCFFFCRKRFLLAIKNLSMNSEDKKSRSPAVMHSRTGWCLFRTIVIYNEILLVIRSNPIDNDDRQQQQQQIVQRALHEITQLSPPKQVAIGGISGM